MMLSNYKLSHCATTRTVSRCVAVRVVTVYRSTLTFLDCFLVVFNCLRQCLHESFSVAMRHDNLHALFHSGDTVVHRSNISEVDSQIKSAGAD